MSLENKRRNAINRIGDLGAFFVLSIRYNSALDHYDINVDAENILIPILKEVYGWEELANLNAEQGNYPGVDLGDKTARVAVQVTSTTSSKKITHTLTKFHDSEKKLYEQYRHLIVYIITEKKLSKDDKLFPKARAGFQEIVDKINDTLDTGSGEKEPFKFSVDEDIRDFEDLLKEIKDLPLDKIQRIEALFAENFVPGSASKVGDEPSEIFHGVPEFPRYGLVGRDALLADLISRLTSDKQDNISLSTSGIGGVGKTALAAAVAHHRLIWRHFRDGVLWASVGPEGDALLELGRWAEALDINPADYPQPAGLKQAVRESISRRRMLLVLDDIWDLEQAELLRCGGPACAHLLTSRDDNLARKFAGKRHNALDVPDLEEDPAFALLNEIAPEACAVDEEAARNLVRQVGGLPLAVELLGGYLTAEDAPDPELFPELSQELLDELEDSELRLRQAQRRIGDVTGQAVSLADVMALSLEGFDEEEQAAFYALGAFAPKPAAFSRDAAEAVSQAGGKLLSRLVTLNLLEKAGSGMALHQVLADLARGRMDEAAQERHAAYYLNLVNEDRTDWQRIDNAYEQIRWAWEKSDDGDCLDWVWALRQHQVTRGLWLEKITWHERGLAWARENEAREDEATLLNNIAWANQATGRPAEALARYEEALPIRREVGDRAGEATTLWNLARLLQQLERVPEAIVRIEEAIALFRAGLTYDSASDTVEGYEEYLKKLQSGEPLSDSSPVDELQQALIAFLDAPDWPASRQVLETQQESLLSAEADETLAGLIEQARTTQNNDTIQFLEMHRDLLRRCKEIGIEAAFDELQMQEGQSFLDDFLEQSIEALRGDNQQKLQFAQQLASLSAADEEDEALQAFYTALQNALFGADLATAGANLQSPYKEIWQAIQDELANDTP